MSAASSTRARRQPGAQAVVQRGRVRAAAWRAGGLPRASPRSCIATRTATATELRRAIGARFRLDPGADRLRRRVGRPDLPALPRLWRARPRHRDVDARLRHLPYRRHLCRQPGDQGAGARPDRRCRCHAGGGVAGDAAGVPRQSEQPDRQPCCRNHEMARLRAGLPPEVLLVLDAAYAEYVDDPDYDPGIAAGRCRRQHGDAAHLLARSSDWAACGSAGPMRRRRWSMC